ncbi:MAG: phosphohistidine phosphatase SixA [Desulfobacteraceae bacterium]|nr:MAG: phosphohistidine phosphatase SixA [Desulfobacteraceae bacterium]
MALYLVQHGKSLPKEQDPRQGLSDTGVAEVRRIAQVAGQYGVRVSAIVHSGKLRAAQTAEILAQALNPARGISATEGIGPLDDVEAYAPHIDLKKDELIVGHLPFLEKLTAYLITAKTAPPVFRMQNGGIVCLDHYPQTTQAVIRWALMPHIG